MRKIYLFLSSTVLILLYTSCNNVAEKKVSMDDTTKLENMVHISPEQLKNFDLSFDTLMEKNISTILKVNGKIEVSPQNLISVSMPLGGYLKYTNLIPGTYVSKGEIIATLEDQQYIQLQQDYLVTKAKLEYAQKDYKRQKELNAEKASSDKIFQMAETEFKTLSINEKSLAEKLKLINISTDYLHENSISKTVNIYAPINCYVSKVFANVGKYITPTEVMFELINPNDIHLTLNVFEKDIHKLSNGQRLVAYSNIQNGIKYGCQIIQISKNISEDHTAEIHCHFDKYNKQLIPGMYMNAEISLNKILSKVLPLESVVHYEGKDFVFVESQKNTFLLQEVKLGNSDEQVVVITNEEDLYKKQIVIKGAYTLLMKLKNTE